MDIRVLIAIIIVVVAAIVVAAVIINRRRRSEHLKERFGPEYDRTLKQHGDSTRAEAVLIDREKRVEKFTLRNLNPADRERYAGEWAAVQRRFVDEPSAAVTEADKLVTNVMAARGYPMGDFEQRAADISVNYPTVVQNYRAAREITVRHERGQSSTEDLRRAMVYFRSLFDELLGTPKTASVGAPHERLAS
jgi:FtsZ-interacting cell division protein ZipA